MTFEICKNSWELIESLINTLYSLKSSNMKDSIKGAKTSDFFWSLKLIPVDCQWPKIRELTVYIMNANPELNNEAISEFIETITVDKSQVERVSVVAYVIKKGNATKIKEEYSGLFKQMMEVPELAKPVKMMGF